jgi:hypothetical protein
LIVIGNRMQPKARLKCILSLPAYWRNSAAITGESGRGKKKSTSHI